MKAFQKTEAEAVPGIEPSPDPTASNEAGIPHGTPWSQKITVHTSDVDGDLARTLLIVATDVLSVGATFLLAYWLRFETSLFVEGVPHQSVLSARAYWAAGVVITSLFVLILGHRNMYGPRRNTSLSEEFVNVAKATSVGMIVVLAATFFYRDVAYSRAMFLFFWVMCTLLLSCGRAGTIAWERRMYRANLHLQKTVIIGGGAVADEVYRELDGHESFGISVKGYFADADASGLSSLGRTVQRLGTPTQAVRYIKKHRINLVLIAVAPSKYEQLPEIIRECEGSNINLLMVPDFLGKIATRVNVKELGSIPFIDIKSRPLTLWSQILKRAIDIVASAALLVLLAPLLVLLAVLVRLTSPGPILFVQRRVGLVGKEFSMYKFRSMSVGSESTDRQAGLGIKNDLRCTRLGALMRKTSLDELPQLFNVLKGEMSLIGPRPERTHCVEDFQHVVSQYVERHRVKTGMTGWAQVNGLRGDTSLPERIKHDLYYIDNWSLALDLRIILQTVRAIIQQ